MRESQPHGRVRNHFENATWYSGLERLLHEDRVFDGRSNSIQITMLRAIHEFIRMHVQVKVLRSESARHAVGSW